MAVLLLIIIIISRQYFAYADDTVHLSRDFNTLNDILTQMENQATLAGLEINSEKTKYMTNLNSDVIGINRILNGASYEEVRNFRYLGSMVSRNNDIQIEIKEKLATGNRCLRSLNKIIQSRYISKKVKIRIYKTIIKPAVVYGSESWTISERVASMLATWERKILRKIYGPTKDKGTWRIRTNQEIYDLYKDNDIVIDIKVRRIEWLGHICRMNDTRLPRMILNAKLDGRRKVGRPRLRWIDDVQADLRKIGITNWWKKAVDRGEWMAVKREAKVKLKGPSRQ